MALASGAFALAWRRRSFPVAGLLAASGMIFAVTSVIATDYFADMTIPGPILGVVFGLAIFGLSAAKGAGTARMPVMAAR